LFENSIVYTGKIQWKLSGWSGFVFVFEFCFLHPDVLVADGWALPILKIRKQ